MYTKFESIVYVNFCCQVKLSCVNVYRFGVKCLLFF